MTEKQIKKMIGEALREWKEEQGYCTCECTCKAKEKVIGRVKEDEWYFYIDDTEGIIEDTDNYVTKDNNRWYLGNYFHTEKEAEKYRDYLKAVATVKMAILKANGDWVADWNDEDQEKYGILYYGKKFMSWTSGGYKELQVIPYCASEEVAKQIIKDFEKELEIIRDYL